MANIPFLNNAYFSSKVGIGIDDPAQQLEILYPSYINKDTVEGLLRLTGQSNTENAGDIPSAGVAIEFYNKWTGGLPYSIGRISARASQSYDGGLQFDVAQNSAPGQSNFTTAMTILDSGNVGIGTTSPDEKLDVVGKQIFSGTGSSHYGNPAAFNTASNGDKVILYNDGTSYDGRIGVGSTSNLWLKSYGETANEGDIELHAGGSERVIVKGSGNVGIGTTSPGAKLEISEASSGSQYEALRLTNTADSGNMGAYISWKDSYATDQLQIVSQRDGAGNGSILTFNQRISGALSPVLVLKNGNVGIGTTSPGEKLHVLGKALLNNGSSLYIDSLATQTVFANIADIPIRFQTNSANRLTIGGAGVIQFNNYDSTNNTGTPTYLLGTDASGNVVKTNTVPGSAAGPYLPLAGGTMTGTTNHNDNVYSRWGTGGDLRLWHNGTNSYVFNYGGNLYIGTGDVDKDTVFLGDDGSGGETTYFYVDGSNSRTQFLKELDLADNIKFRAGNAGDLQIYHDGSHSYIRDTGVGNLIITGSQLTFSNVLDTEYMAKMVQDGTVELYYNGSKKFETTSTGVTITGAATATTFLGDLNGTINTATTGVTQVNSVDNTTIATTAYVNNKIALIPAGLVFQGTWNAATNTPTLTGGSGTTGNFYIVSVAGSTNLDGITDWKVGDWAVFIEQGASDQWEKIDNSSVLDGFGTGQSVTKWDGSGTSNTLTNGPITFSGNNSTFAGTITAATYYKSSGTSVVLGTNASGEVLLRPNSSITSTAQSSFTTTLATIGTNATFAGTSTFGGDLYLATNTDILKAGTNPFRVFTNGTLGFSLSASQNATFAGNVTATSYKIGGVTVLQGTSTVTVGSGGGTGKVQLNTTSGVGLILDGSNVGIGTTNPGAKLEVKSGDLIINNSGAKIDFRDGGGNSKYFLELANSNADLRINDRTGAGSVSMTVQSGGNVGIGTTSPGALLEISGNAGADPGPITNPTTFRITDSGNAATGAGDTTNDWGKIEFYSEDQSSSGPSVQAQIGTIYDNIYSTASNLAFKTRTSPGAALTERLRIKASGALSFYAYGGSNNTGTPTYLLGTDASGDVVKTLSTPSSITSQAASLYDLIPNGAFTTTYAFTSTAGVYAEVMSGDDVITETGTYSVQMFVNDYPVGGTQYSETYSGVMTWHDTSTNDAGVGAISEIVLHRAGHAGNQGITYLRTRETTNADNNELKLEIMCNKTYTSASNVVFKFVRLI